MLLKLIIALVGFALIAMGLRSIYTREALFWGDDDGERRVVEGFPAVLVGLIEIAVGVYVLIHRQWPVF